MNDPANTLMFSAASLWEIAIKQGLGVRTFMLVAQALVEGVTLVTADAQVTQYPVAIEKI